MRKTVVVAAAILTAGAAQAREPGIAPQFPPGQTLGLANAVSPPPGLYLMNRLAWYDAELRDDAGRALGQHATVRSEAIQLTWVPGLSLLGGDYKAFVNLPLVDMTVTRRSPATGRPGRYHSSGVADPKVQPLDLSWKLGDGWFAGAGLGVYVPVGTYSANADINIGQHFWTVEPGAALTYLKDGWNASLHVLYDVNTENTANHYRSGDQVFVNATVTRNLAGWDVGPVGYAQKQVTDDRNDGGAATFRGTTASPSEQLGLGLLASHALGPAKVTAFVTRDVEARNTLGGDKLWLNVSLPLR
ncbi:MAG: transporter [Bacteroidales bacterium]